MLRRFWRWLIGTRLPPPVLEQQPPKPDALMSLLATLTEASTERYKAQLEHDAKIEDLQLRKHELEVQNASSLAEARAIERKAKEELRERKREQANNWNSKHRQHSLRECPVCTNSGSPTLTAAQIGWHHNGHVGPPPGPVVN